MKTLKYVFILLTFAGFIMSGCSDKSQLPVDPSQQGSLEKLVRTDFTARSYPTGNIDPGELKIVDGNMFLRNRKDYLTIESANPFINTTNGIITYNVNADALTTEGHGWGTIIFILDAYPELEVSGTWNGQIKMTGASEWTLVAKLVAHIRGGSTNGIQIFWDNVVTYTDPTASYWEGNLTGYIQYTEK